MKTLSLKEMENIIGESKFGDFCAGFGAGQVGIAVAVKIGLIAAPPIGATVGAVILAIDIACAAEWFF